MVADCARPPRAQRRTPFHVGARGFSGGRLGGVGGGCGRGPAPGRAARHGTCGAWGGTGAGGAAAGHLGWRRGARLAGGVSEYSGGKWEAALRSRGPCFTALPPRRPCPELLDELRSASVDAGVSTPSSPSWPTGADQYGLGGRRARSRRLSLGPGSPRGGGAKEDRSPAGNLGGGRPPPSRPLPPSPKLGAPRAPIPVGSLNRARLPALPKAAHHGPGPSLGRGRAEGGTGQRTESRRRPFARGPGARSAPPTPCPARRCFQPRAHRPHRGRAPTPQSPAPGPRPREQACRPEAAGHLPAAPKPRDAPPLPLPKRAEPGKWGLTSKVFLFGFVFKTNCFHLSQWFSCFCRHQPHRGRPGPRRVLTRWGCRGVPRA